MHTPFFPEFRPRLAPCRRRLTQTVRQASLAELERYLEGIFPPHLLSQEEEGLNSRDRIYSLRLTFECFLWQLLKPKTACREVVRQVQALFRLKGRGPVDEDTGAYCQARQRLPKTRLEQMLAATAATADRRAGSGGTLGGRPVKGWSTPPPRRCPIPKPTSAGILNPRRSSPAAASQSLSSCCSSP